MEELEAAILSKRMELFKLEGQTLENMAAFSKDELNDINKRIDLLEKEIENIGKLMVKEHDGN